MSFLSTSLRTLVGQVRRAGRDRRHYGVDVNAPTLATWERERTELEAAYVLMVTGHWVAVRGKWFCDTFIHGVPVRIKDAPPRRKRVHSVYQITVDRR